MTLADDLKAIAFSIRSIPGDLGIRPYTVSVNVSWWDGGHVGDGVETTTTTAITEANGKPPRVRLLNEEERTIAGMPDGSWEIGPVTPDHAGGGTSWATLTGAAALDAPGPATVSVTLTGPAFPTGSQFGIAQAYSDRALHYRLIVKPLAAK